MCKKVGVKYSHTHECTLRSDSSEIGGVMIMGPILAEETNNQGGSTKDSKSYNLYY